MARPRVRTPLVVAVDRIIKSLSPAPYFPGKKIATLGPSAGGGRLVHPSSVVFHPRPVTSLFFLLAGKSGGYRTTTGGEGERKKESARVGDQWRGSEPTRDDTRCAAFIYQVKGEVRRIMSASRFTKRTRDIRSASYSVRSRAYALTHARVSRTGAGLTRSNIDRGQ